jgi:hypothetical protein
VGHELEKLYRRRKDGKKKKKKKKKPINQLKTHKVLIN